MRRTLPPIVLVDNDANDLFLVRWGLEKAGVVNPVVAFTDAEKAREFLAASIAPEGGGAARRPCVIFLDIAMPRRDGFGLLKWARDQGALDETRLVVLSGSREPQDRERAVQLGANDYLMKFATTDELADIVGSAKGGCVTSGATAFPRAI